MYKVKIFELRLTSLDETIIVYIKDNMSKNIKIGNYYHYFYENDFTDQFEVIDISEPIEVSIILGL